ncbi:hypothetical protein COO60DRAFT_1525237 [Scenedesmus sp. NREL 46B-D3]|nr:hypothetical protein COO60DRAFT_1525237 [Scenedesmus sp. NREL 46B-D3]
MSTSGSAVRLATLCRGVGPLLAAFCTVKACCTTHSKPTHLGVGAVARLGNITLMMMSRPAHQHAAASPQQRSSRVSLVHQHQLAATKQQMVMHAFTHTHVGHLHHQTDHRGLGSLRTMQGRGVKSLEHLLRACTWPAAMLTLHGCAMLIQITATSALAVWRRNKSACCTHIHVHD